MQSLEFPLDGSVIGVANMKFQRNQSASADFSRCKLLTMINAVNVVLFTTVAAPFMNVEDAL